MSTISGQTKLARVFLKGELIFVFGYAATGILLSPEEYVKWLPNDLFGLLASHEILAVNLFGAVEVLFVAWMIVGKRADIAALTGVFLLLAITFLNLDMFDILFRNIGLAFGAFGLFILERQERRRISLIGGSN